MKDYIGTIMHKYIMPDYPKIVGYNIRTYVEHSLTVYDVKVIMMSKYDAVEQRKLYFKILTLFNMLGPSKKEGFQIWFSLD